MVLNRAINKNVNGESFTTCFNFFNKGNKEMKKESVKKATVKNTNKKATAKTQQKAVAVMPDSSAAAESGNIKLYAESLISAADAYVARRLINESDAIASKKREIKAFNLRGLTVASFKLLKRIGFQASDIENMPLTFYAKSFKFACKYINGLTSGEYISEKENCFAGCLVDLKKAAEKALYIKKELAFCCSNAGHIGGGYAHACQLGRLTGLFKLGTWDEKIKVVRLNSDACELLKKMTVQSPLYYAKGIDNAAAESEDSVNE